MAETETPAWWPALRYLTHGVQALILGVAIYALASFKVGEAINVGIPVAIAAVPTLLRYAYGYRINPVLGLWIALSAGLHVGGSLGLYQSIGWYDQLAHAVSASLVAGIGYAVVRALEETHEEIVIPSRLRFVFLFVIATAFGVLWEVGEFASGQAAAVMGGKAVLAQYGLSDAVLDIGFDAVGALVVAAVGTSYFRPVTRLFRGESADHGEGTAGESDS
ncbi:MAG: hypothetical protein ABEJ31_15490 [Haloarculaceae archaeon]